MKTNAYFKANDKKLPHRHIKRVLTRGLNFTITPRVIPQDEYILATELACHKIQDQGLTVELRNTVAGIFRSAKLPRSNITKEGEKAIIALK